ncbi:MAG: hypothetical protein WKF37_13140 [Bryobacteraceae bacterium]
MKFALLILLIGAAASAAIHCVTIAGIGGEPDYEQRFANWAKDIDKTWKAAPETKSEVLSGPDATKTKVREVLERLARDSKPQDILIVALLGHGSFDGQEYKFNIPGPDLSAIELASLLDRIPSAKQMILNATSASGHRSTPYNAQTAP